MSAKATRDLLPLIGVEVEPKVGEIPVPADATCSVPGCGRPLAGFGKCGECLGYGDVSIGPARKSSEDLLGDWLRANVAPPPETPAEFRTLAIQFRMYEAEGRALADGWAMLADYCEERAS